MDRSAEAGGGLLMVWETADPRGGAGNVQVNLARYMPEVCRSSAQGFSLPIWKKAVLRFTHFHPDRHLWHRKSTISPMGFALRSSMVRRLIRKRDGRPAAVFQLYGMFSGRVEGAAHVLYLDYTRHLSDGSSPRPPAGYERWIGLERELYGSADLLLVVGEHVGDDLVSFYGVPQDKVVTVGYGLEDVFFEGEPVVRDGPGTRFLFVCSEDASWKKKGGDVIMEAFGRLRSEMPGCELTVLGIDGDGPEGVIFAGSVMDRREVAGIYRSSDIYVSLPYIEPFGIAYLEAMASGCAVIGSTADAGPFVIEDGVSGYLVQPGDAGTLYDRMSSLALDPVRRAEFAGRARERAGWFRWQKVVGRMKREMDARGIGV